MCTFTLFFQTLKEKQGLFEFSLNVYNEFNDTIYLSIIHRFSQRDQDITSKTQLAGNRHDI